MLSTREEGQDSRLPGCSLDIEWKQSERLAAWTSERPEVTLVRTQQIQRLVPVREDHDMVC